MRLCVKEKVPQAGGNQTHLLLSFRQEFRMELRPTNKGGRIDRALSSSYDKSSRAHVEPPCVFIFVHWLLTW